MFPPDDLKRQQIAQLRDLFCKSLTFSQLQYILTDLYGSELISSLPIGAVTYIEYCQEAVLALERRGLINAELFKKIIERTPQRQVDVVAVADFMGIQLTLDDLRQGEDRTGVTEGQISLRNLDLVTLDANVGEPNPARFFLGYPPTWADLGANLDVQRSVIFQEARVPYEYFRDQVLKNSSPSHIYLVFGEGGAGKSTLLRRLMYDFAASSATVFRAYYETAFSINDVVKYAQMHPTLPTYIFIDNAQAQARRIIALSKELSIFPNRLAIIAASRKNEWNYVTRRLSLAPYDEVYLSSLTEIEASDLLNKLTIHDSLG